MNIRLLGAGMIAAALIWATPAAAADTRAMRSEALILKPLTLTKLDDLDFGTIVPSRNAGGDFVTINAVTGARTSPSATLIASDPGHRARFASTGFNNSFVFLELSPPPYAPLVNAAGNRLKLEYLTLDGSALRMLTPTSQIFFVGIGGEILVRADQEDGAYSGSFTLTATYL